MQIRRFRRSTSPTLRRTSSGTAVIAAIESTTRMQACQISHHNLMDGFRLRMTRSHAWTKSPAAPHELRGGAIRTARTPCECESTSIYSAQQEGTTASDVVFEWPGLHTWRKTGVDQRTRWGPNGATATEQEPTATSGLPDGTLDNVPLAASLVDVGLQVQYPQNYAFLPAHPVCLALPCHTMSYHTIPHLVTSSLSHSHFLSPLISALGSTSDLSHASPSHCCPLF